MAGYRSRSNEYHIVRRRIFTTYKNCSLAKEPNEEGSGEMILLAENWLLNEMEIDVRM